MARIEACRQPMPRLAFFSFFFFCFSFVESFGLLSFLLFSIPLATRTSSLQDSTITATGARRHAALTRATG
jgi:hypothetical protein